MGHGILQYCCFKHLPTFSSSLHQPRPHHAERQRRRRRRQSETLHQHQQQQQQQLPLHLPPAHRDSAKLTADGKAPLQRGNIIQCIQDFEINVANKNSSHSRPSCKASSCENSVARSVRTGPQSHSSPSPPPTSSAYFLPQSSLRLVSKKIGQ